MFKVEETTRLRWDGKCPIDLKFDKREGKTTRLVAINNS
jgi:hypothetical protein